MMRATAAFFLVCAVACSEQQSRPSDASGPATSDERDGAALAADGALSSARDATTSGLPPDAARTDAGATADAGAVAGPQFALTGTQFLLTPRIGLQVTPAELALDGDVVAIHQEFYGVPWAAFEQGVEPPSEWTRVLTTLRDAAVQAGKPIFLSINMLAGSRDTLAERTVIKNGTVETEDGWAAHCYDFASAPDAAEKRAAYLRYVEAMVSLFSPRYLNFAVEINLFLEKCPSAGPGLVALANEAYQTAKARDPALIAFPSFQIDHLYGHSTDFCPDQSGRAACYQRGLAQIADLRRDRFAISSYPYLSGLEPEQLGDDWFVRAANIRGERVVVAETGWLTTNITGTLNQTCTTQVRSDPDKAQRYLELLLRRAYADQMELVTWWSDRDLLPSDAMTSCPCKTADPTWCSVLDVFRATGKTPETAYLGEVLLKAFGSMGIRDYQGQPKPLFATWNTRRR